MSLKTWAGWLIALSIVGYFNLWGKPIVTPEDYAAHGIVALLGLSGLGINLYLGFWKKEPWFGKKK